MSAEKDFTEVALDTLGRDVLSLIFERMDPKSILKLCQTSQAFAEHCRNPSLWRRLIALHFPWDLPTNDPRSQYQALVAGHKTVYTVLGSLEKVDVLYLDKERAIKSDYDRIDEVSIDGNPVPNGTKLWLYGLFFSEGGDEKSWHRTRQEAIDDFFENFFDNLVFEIKMDIDNSDGYYVGLQDYAYLNDLAYPMTEERWREWFDEMDSISFKAGLGFFSYVEVVIREIEFKDKYDPADDSE